MSENDIREPIQKRSIEKKQKIIQAGFELICKKDIIIQILLKLQKLQEYLLVLFIIILKINMIY